MTGRVPAQRIDGRPRIFDAIEFNDAIACIDVLYVLAFLFMDLEHRGLRGHAIQMFASKVQGASIMVPDRR